MARRKPDMLSRHETERARAKIQLPALIDRIQRFALSQPGRQGEKIDLNSRQLKAALALIDKCLPNLHSTEYVNNTPKRNPEQIESQIAQIVQNLDDRSLAQLKGLLVPQKAIDVIPEQVEH